MLEIDKTLLDALLEKATASERRRMNFDLRTCATCPEAGLPVDGSQRMLNALLPGTCVPVHRHPRSNENVLCLRGRLDEVLYAADGREVERISLCPAEGRYGCVIPAGAWHTVEVLEPSVIYEAKDGRFGEDGSEDR